MRVGIISMQRVANYGSFLQAYGLKKLIESLGHEVCFIDYEEGKPVVSFSKSAYLKYRILNISGVKLINDWFKYHVLKKHNFVYEYRMHYLKELGIGYRKKNGHVDMAVIGSDEVFNCLQSGFNVGFSPMLFGQNVPADRVISYAASFGYTNLDSLNKYHVSGKIGEYLKTFSAISVRDENSYEIVHTLTGTDPSVNLDPVLVSDFDIPEIDIPYENYVILYTYKSRVYSDKEKQMIRDFCSKNGKTLLSVGNAQNWVDVHVHASPFELLSYIRKADFIITDTFHGSVFSIKFNKPFATLIRDNNRQKLSDLLNRLKRSDRIINSFDELQMMYDKQTDYTETNQVIAREKKKTVDYLVNNLKQES